jgi:hypothetical protein
LFRIVSRINIFAGLKIWAFSILLWFKKIEFCPKFMGICFFQEFALEGREKFDVFFLKSLILPSQFLILRLLETSFFMKKSQFL